MTAYQPSLVQPHRAFPRRIPLLMTLAVGVAFCAAGPAGAKSDALLSPRQQSELTRLKAQAAGRDFDKALGAIEGIAKMGAPAREELRGLLGRLRQRNAFTIEACVRAAGAVEPFERATRELRELRAKALANIAKLKKDDGSIPLAETYSRELRDRTRRLGPQLAARVRLLEAAGQRSCLLALCRRYGPDGAKVGSATADPDPLVLAGQVLGTSLDGVRGWKELERRPELKDVTTYRFNRRAQRYNRRVLRSMHPEEARNVLAVNDYREALGLLRLEADERLVQSARRHSKEMAELGYFSHQSPTKGLRSHGDRMKAAGYPGGGGENIALGRHRGLDVFGMWFRSPGHHRNMASGRYTALGVGKWGAYFTQNFGSAPRLMDATDAQRSAAKPKGDILPRGR